MSDATRAIERASTGATIFGVITLVAGVLSVVYPLLSGVGLSVFLAFVILTAGVMRTIYAFRSPTFAAGAFRFIFGLVSILAGILIFANPMIGLLSLTSLLIAWFLLDGIMDTIGAVQIRPESGWGWMLFSGIVSILLAIMLWQQLPSSAVWVPGTLVGLRLIFSGWAMIACGFVGREASRAAAA